MENIPWIILFLEKKNEDKWCPGESKTQRSERIEVAGRKQGCERSEGNSWKAYRLTPI